MEKQSLWTLTDYFKIDVLFNVGDSAFLKNAEFYAYISDRIDEFGKGIEKVFAEYFFNRRKKDDL